MDETPIVFLPLGAVEWHGWHAPVGLDSLVAQSLCLRAAEVMGGVVYPPFHCGMYGSIAANPWTILEENPAVVAGALGTILKRLEESGVKAAVIYSGHFALYQIEMLRELQAAWDSRSHLLRLVTLVGSEMPDPPIPPDHGGLFETSLLSVLVPETLDMSALPTTEEHAGDEPGRSANGPQRRDPSHPLYGIMGADPRSLETTQAEALTRQLIGWIVQEARSALAR